MLKELFCHQLSQRNSAAPALMEEEELEEPNPNSHSLVGYSSANWIIPCSSA